MAVRSAWDRDVARSNRVVPTVAVADMVMHQIVALDYEGSNPFSHPMAPWSNG